MDNITITVRTDFADVPIDATWPQCTSPEPTGLYEIVLSAPGAPDWSSGLVPFEIAKTLNDYLQGLRGEPPAGTTG